MSETKIGGYQVAAQLLRPEIRKTLPSALVPLRDVDQSRWGAEVVEVDPELLESNPYAAINGLDRVPLEITVVQLAGVLLAAYRETYLSFSTKQHAFLVVWGRNV
jgi:hypothetical protein